MAQLLDAYGRPVRTQALSREHAAPTLAGVRTLWTDTVASGLTPVRLATLLQNAAEGDADSYLTLAEEMEERDLHYAAELSKRKLAVGRLPISVEAVSDQQRDIDIADAVRRLFKGYNVRSLIKDLLDGLGKGYSVVEIDWDRSGPLWKPRGYQWRDPHFFTFARVRRSELRLKDETGGLDGLPLEPFKFVCHVPRIKSGIPLRGGLARLSAWAYMCKGYSIKDWLAFAEVYGMPLRLGKYGSSATDAEKAVLRMALANLGTDAAAMFPESMKIELVEAANKSGAADFFKLLADYFDDQVSKGILGQTASASGSPGKLGNDQLQSEVRDDIRDDDAEQLEDTLKRDLVKPFVDLNFGPQDDYPCVQLRAADRYDMAAEAEALAKLVPLGYRIEQSVIRDRMGHPDPDENAKPEDLLGIPAPVAAEPIAINRATNTEQSAADPLQVTAWVDHLRRLTVQSGSFEELARNMEKAFPEMDSTAMATEIAQVTTRAIMAGRLDAAQKSPE